jgi:glycosyltransferase involved in cell wall biosynthesis
MIKSRLFLYAPNVHIGGGLNLLKLLLLESSNEKGIDAILDIRCRKTIAILNLKNIRVIFWVKPNFFSWVASELMLFIYTKESKDLLCLHNLPPIFPRAKKIFIFLQNRLLVEPHLEKVVKPSQILKTRFEKLISKLFYRKQFHYLVQTESMKTLTVNWLKTFQSHQNNKDNPKVTIAPFYVWPKNITSATPIEWDFIYVSSGERHKNHLTLLDAWEILAKENIYPSLAITVDENCLEITNRLHQLSDNIKIFNLGILNHESALSLYPRSRAFIFPSLTESHGLPLIEANFYKIPIVAGECDFVRDVCSPVETFDPYSAKSISRAVKRFLNIPQTQIQPMTPKEFINMFDSRKTTC